MTDVPPNDAELEELLDDAFEQFTIDPPKPKEGSGNAKAAAAASETSAVTRSQGQGQGQSQSQGKADADVDAAAALQDEFAQQLAKGMEALLKDSSALGADGKDDGDMQKTLEHLLKQLGTMQADVAATEPSAAPASAPAAAPALAKDASFQDKIKATMDKLKESADQAEGSAGEGLGDMGMMDELLRQMDSMGDDAQLDSLVDDVIGQLMSKDVLHQPLKDLDDAYPKYLEAHKDTLPSDEYARYAKQHTYIKQILRLFDEEPGDAASDPRIAQLMQEMQDCGQPPAELLKVLAPDMELDERGQPKEPELPGCCVM
ncbi:Peroxisome chaperone and import receptor [Coemansia sp. Benny D115]|nr:Peroxisome chaperone and import receptor [Coemansia sp. Benny D115]